MKKKIRIFVDQSNNDLRPGTRSQVGSVASSRKVKKPDFDKLVPGTGGNTVGGNLRASKQSRDAMMLEKDIAYMDLDAQMRYIQERLEEAKGTTPSYKSNKNHKLPLPSPPKGTSSLAMVKRGGRFTPGRIKLPTNT